jgi:hypothetical protein
MNDSKLTTANVVWIATALLHNENKDKDVFSAKQIFDKTKSLGLLKLADATITMHISLHCVANEKAQPNNHRKLFRVVKGWYRLYRPGDVFDETRASGRSAPLVEELPEKYQKLVEWYNTVYCKQERISSQENGNHANTAFAKIEDVRNLSLPEDVCSYLQVEEGDYIAFIMKSKGEIIIKKAKMRLEV